MFVINAKKLVLVLRRHYSKYRYREITSVQVRKKFFEYFINENDHILVKSSPVIPYCDPTLTFVNAGMNQFKGIFLEQREPPALKVANSQKCIRVGGKHNDLDIVGKDGYHHTFFEMLGNWSFGAYFKKEACELAWNLLTGPYNLKPSSLYVTYFGGDKDLNLEADLETLDVWRTIGVAEENILPFGLSDNFWEMGLTGPCGPCTEIHYDHTNGSNRSADVNKGLANLTELWNIVFIQYNREINGSIRKLKKQYVDTGMGFERLTAILQNKSSNYETDLFLPIFERIQQTNRNIKNYRGLYGNQDVDGLDTAYRVIADHARMATVCLADGMIPEENYKLRKIIRRANLLGDRYFKRNKNFLWNVCEAVTDTLGAVYPEIITNKKKIQNILYYEEQVLQALRMEKYPEWIQIISKSPHLEEIYDMAEIPSLVLGYREILKLKNNLKITEISADLSFKLYDTYGLDKDKIIELANIFNITFDVNSFITKLNTIRKQSKALHINKDKLENIFDVKQIPPTNDLEKYNYNVVQNEYVFKNPRVKLLGILKDNEVVTEINTNDKDCLLIFDQTCFYSESGGQESDKGEIIFENSAKFQVMDVYKFHAYIIHYGKFTSENLVIKCSDYANLHLDVRHRLGNMRNHSATHILNSAIKIVLKNSTTCQKSSKVTSDELKFDFYVFGKEKITTEHVENIEKLVNNVISSKIDVLTDVVNQEKLFKGDITLVPGEVYPTLGIRLIQISSKDFQSKEACCGTHIRNTSHINNFVITSFKKSGRASYSLKGVTGDRAVTFKKVGQELEELILNLNLYEKTIDTSVTISDLSERVQLFLEKLNDAETSKCLSYLTQSRCKQKLKFLNNILKLSEQQNLRGFIKLEIETSLKEISDNGQPWLVHFLRSNSIAPSLPLVQATNVCPHLPIIILAYYNGIVRGRCCVPEDYVTDEFDAEKWMKYTIGEIFSGKLYNQKDENPIYACNMKEVKVSKDKWDQQLQLALDLANKYAETHVAKLKKTSKHV